MGYQVIARKWRPQRFDDVVGQQAVTRTLRNALTSKRLAHAFVFAGPRGVGKTTPARILARALNGASGPTPDPCGRCDACVEIAEGRDIDVLEIDAATHTQVDNIREVIISGLAITPVRNRYKVFIIDEVHQLSGASFNALLKSIEEPPPHVVFMMATTELDKIPDTVLSRAQVYEFKTIGTRPIAEQLRKVVDAEGIAVGDDSLQLIARDADGSMRDAQSKLDQVIAFTGKTITAADVGTVLGLVGRDLLLDALEAVADEDEPAAFALTARAVAVGWDLRAVCREHARGVRDLLVLSVDGSRISDPEIAGEGEGDRLKALVGSDSRDELLRAFDLLTRAEFDIRTAAQPRYHLEMALLRWIYLRKLRPIEDLIAGAPATAAGPTKAAAVQGSQPSLRAAAAAAARAIAPGTPDRGARTPVLPAPGTTAPSTQTPGTIAPITAAPITAAPLSFKDALLAEMRKSKAVFYNVVAAQAQKIEVSADRVTFSFSANQRHLRDQFEQNRGWLESMAQQISGRTIAFSSTLSEPSVVPSPPRTDGERPADRKASLKEQALADAGVQTMLEVFPAEIRDVEEM